VVRETSIALARWLASRDRDLDEAVALAASALEIADDMEVRRELAAWLESLGEAARASAALRPIAAVPDIPAGEAAYVLVRTGVLKARAGAAAGAAAAFESALPIDPEDALPAELVGSIASWQPDAVPPAAAAEAYLEAARRRAAQGDEEAELEDLWRAFAMDEASGQVAASLSSALAAGGRPGAGDEVLRWHARSLADAKATAGVHAARRAAALEAGDSLRALGAAFDEGLDARLDPEGASQFDALLLELGMLESIAARLQTRADRSADGAERAARLVDLGRLCSGMLADPGRASAAYAAALAADPACEEAHSALGARGHVPFGGGETTHAALAREWVRAAMEGDVRNRAGTLERFSTVAAPPLRAVLLTVAAERHRAAGDLAAARRAAELSTNADPGTVRGVTTLADIVVAAGDQDRAAAAALERAVVLVGPRMSWVKALADALESLGENELAVGWTQRWVALRRGDRVAIERLFDRLLKGRDTGRIADALAWLLSQPQPAAWLAEPFSRALGALVTFDPERAAVVARRALEVFGPKLAVLRGAMLEVAASARDDAFAAAVLERWLASGAQGAERRDVLTRLAGLRAALGDEESEARVLARAMSEGASNPDLERHLARMLEGPATPDAQIWRLRAVAERLPPEKKDEEAAWAWRDLGAALWDLADDRLGAIAAWQRAARTARSRGHATFALDLVAFSDASFAFEYLVRLVETEPDADTAAIVAADVARAAAAMGEVGLAFDLAARGLARKPACAEALEVAEESAEEAGQTTALSALYELVAERALGRFGRRAAHYRGARYFDRHGQPVLALKHAAQAFYAVPSEGSAFQLLARAAERAGDRTHAVRTVEQVAEHAGASTARAAWLLRAASIAGPGEEGARRRVDVLLRAVLAFPAVGTIALLRDAAAELLRYSPEDRDVTQMRLERAVKAVTQRLEGPDGARAAIAFALAFLELFSDAQAAFSSVVLAFACDPDIDEYVDLVPRAEVLATAPDAAAKIGDMLASAEAVRSNVGIAALRLVAAMSSALGDPELRSRAVVAAAVKEWDDDALVVAADEAVRALPELLERLTSRVPPARRAEALLAAARAHAGRAEYAASAPLFERAITLLDAANKHEVERELRAAWDAAGRGTEIEARVQQEAASDSASPATRADRWTEIAERREARGDAAGAVQAAREACRLDPAPLVRWSALERLAEIAADDDTRITALEHIAERVEGDGRVAVYKRLARAHERRSDFEAAERAWQLVLAADPEDDEAEHAIETAIVNRGRFDELAHHLALRSERLVARSGSGEALRAVRLRRAAILEQRLGRIEDACEELELLLQDAPENTSALRYLADLLDRQGLHARSAPVWARAAALEVDSVERDGLELRAGRAAGAAGDLDAALEAAQRVLSRRPASRDALILKVEGLRAKRADAELADALEALAAAEGTDAESRSDYLLEAAQAAARLGDMARALDRARRSSAAVSERSTPLLLARGLEYRVRGAGAPEDARRTIDELTRMQKPAGVDDAALRAFLLAEARDVVQGGGAGMRELEEARAQLGEHSLLAVGIAERLTALGQHARAVTQYRVALEGSLIELRRPPSVALAAADAAIRAGLPSEAQQFLEIAEVSEEVRAAVSVRRATLAQLFPPAAPSLATVDSAPVEAGSDTAFEALEAAVRVADTPTERAEARLALGRARLESGDTKGAEPLLWQALADGLVDAGDMLAPILASAPDRTRELVRVRRQQVALEPGDVGRLESLRAAALADQDRVYARAVEHVLRAFDPGAGPLPPPPLASQPEQSGIVAFLARPAMDTHGEALSLLWEGASQLFVREASSYGITGVDRVVPGSSSVIARLYEAAIRVLEAPRIPLFVPRGSTGAPLARVAVLSQPSVILAGDMRDETADIRFALGRGMAAALPHNVLRLGLPESEGRSVRDALRAAFGAPELGRRVEARAAQLAESFWQTIPARTQRRLQELLGAAPIADYDELVERAHQSGRRVGMFLCGDFAYAARVALAESVPRLEDEPNLGTLQAICATVPALADLLRLAVSPEYANARWHMVQPPIQRSSASSSGRFSVF
jgi:tetratricopeptide (TPR) repeat protein